MSDPQRGQDLYRDARRRIPGGTQLLSKRPEMFLPGQWPAYYGRARGVETWDLEGRRYVDMGYCGIGSCILGFADPDVDDAVREALARGSMSTLNCPEEVELAELLCEIHPWASMVRYARTGGEAMALAVRIARAATSRDQIAFCGYHGWHDWYLAANLAADDALDGHLLPGLDPAGVPRSLQGTAHPFHYNRPEELEALVDSKGDSLAAVIMEPVRHVAPESGFLEEVRKLADRVGAVLIFDEITAGWRFTPGGVHLRLGVEPDIAVFAKAISNGYSMAAVIGRADVMDAAQQTFMSSTYWTERIGPTAALATIRKLQREPVARHLKSMGERVQAVWDEEAKAAALPISVTGFPALSQLSFDVEDAQAVKTLFVQEMLRRGFLTTGAFYASYAHREEHVERYQAAVSEVFPLLVSAVESGTVRGQIDGAVAHSGFQRLT